MSQKDMDDVKKAIAAIDAKKKNIRAKIYSGGSTGLVQQKGRIRKNNPEQKTGIIKHIKDTLKSLYKIDLVIIEVGYYMNIIEEDAQYFHKEFEFKIHDRGGNSSYEVAGFPLDDSKTNMEKYKKILLERDISFCFVEQTEVTTNKVTREVTFSSHNKSALGLTFYS